VIQPGSSQDTKSLEALCNGSDVVHKAMYSITLFSVPQCTFCVIMISQTMNGWFISCPAS
jgi:hypothetical protein